MGWAKALFSSSLLPVIETAQVYRVQSLVRFYWKKEFFDIVCVCVCVCVCVRSHAGLVMFDSFVTLWT